MDPSTGKKIVQLRERILGNFNAGDWEAIGLLTGHSDIIDNHPRLLRSLSWGDEDYAGNVLTVLKTVIEKDAKALRIIEDYLGEHYPGNDEYVSAKPSERRIVFAPIVFQTPEGRVEPDLVAVMMPFDAKFNPVFDAIKMACTSCSLRCLRSDDIWEESTIIQDIFNLVYRAYIVVVDFTGKSPNVMYETGIAHTLGKHVVPIAQSIDDVPFDMAHHRVQKYLANREGLADLRSKLTVKLRQVSA